MSKYSEIVPNRKPLRVVIVPTSAWCAEYRKRPTAPVAVGIRLLSDDDIQMIRREAAGATVRMYTGDDGQPVDEAAMTEAYNDALIRWVVGRSVCDPNNTDTSFFESEEETAGQALTSDGLRFLFDHYDALRTECSPHMAAIADADVAEIVRRLGDLSKLKTSRALRARKLLQSVLEDLREVDPTYREPSPDAPIMT